MYSIVHNINCLTYITSFLDNFDIFNSRTYKLVSKDFFEAIEPLEVNLHVYSRRCFQEFLDLTENRPHKRSQIKHIRFSCTNKGYDLRGFTNVESIRFDECKIVISNIPRTIKKLELFDCHGNYDFSSLKLTHFGSFNSLTNRPSHEQSVLKLPNTLKEVQLDDCEEKFDLSNLSLDKLKIRTTRASIVTEKQKLPTRLPIQYFYVLSLTLGIIPDEEGLEDLGKKLGTDSRPIIEEEIIGAMCRKLAVNHGRRNTDIVYTNIQPPTLVKTATEDEDEDGDEYDYYQYEDFSDDDI